MLTRIGRVLLAVVAVIAIAIVLVRQPVLTSLPYRSKEHADARALEQHVRFLSLNRRVGAPEYIASELRASGGTVVEQPFVARKQTYRNVIATFGPDDDKSPLIVVGAHYDAFNDLLAADDNASGTAGLLELARLLGTTKLTRPVVLVAYANEEPPFFASEDMGSFVHASSIAQRRVDAMICLEMIGYFGHEQLWSSWVLSLLYPNDGNFIGVTGGWNDRQLARFVKRAINGAHEVDAVSFTGPHEMLDASDQRNYWSRGWRAVMRGTPTTTPVTTRRRRSITGGWRGWWMGCSVRWTPSPPRHPERSRGT